MTKTIYGHIPPFQLCDQEYDEMTSSIQKQKEQYRETMKDLHNAVVDMVNKPPHYTSGTIECIDYIKDVLTKEEYIGYLRGCMIKYQHRLRHKGDSVENAGKMEWYNKKLKEALE